MYRAIAEFDPAIADEPGAEADCDRAGSDEVRCRFGSHAAGWDKRDVRERAAQLAALKTRCLSEEIDSRPLFDEIAATVASLDRHVREGVKP